MGNVLLEREFNCQLHGIYDVQIGNQNINDRRLRNPTPNSRFGGTPIRGIFENFAIADLKICRKKEIMNSMGRKLTLR